MAKTRAFVETQKGSQYLQQLCKHWSHKGRTEFSPQSGWVAFDSGNRVDLTAAADGLDLVVTSETQDGLDTFREVVVAHLSRFGFRETLRFDWAVVEQEDSDAQD